MHKSSHIKMIILSVIALATISLLLSYFSGVHFLAFVAIIPVLTALFGYSDSSESMPFRHFDENPKCEEECASDFDLEEMQE